MLDILNFKSKIRFFVAFLFIFNTGTVVHATALYEVDILVTDESASVRWDAFKQGLDEIFIRLSGDSIIMDKLKRPAPTTYVKQYSYTPVEEPTITPQGKLLTHHIKIQYNRILMEKYLRQNGFPVWAEHRPEIVIWLVVRDGSNEYVLKQSDQSLLKTAADEAMHRRGVPVRWPLYDRKDRKILSAADIRGGFKDPVTSASKRYTQGPALTGSLLWNGQQWQSSWSLLMQSGNRHWSMVDTDYQLLLSKAIDQAADTLGLIFAVHGSASNQERVSIQLNVQAVSSIKEYRRLERYLTALNAVESIKPLQIDVHSVVFEVTLRSSEGDFLNRIKNDAQLLKVEPQNDKPQEMEPQEILDIKPQIDPATPAIETLPADLGATQPDPITVYYYQLLK